MKNGFFHFGTIISVCLAICILTLLSSCATFLELDERDNVSDYDSGYHEQDEEEEDLSQARAKRLDSASPKAHAEQRVKVAIQARDVILGMTRQDVTSSWGEPNQRAVAGNNDSGHERWTYGSRYSLSGSRTIIFEDGRVAGWTR